MRRPCRPLLRRFAGVALAGAILAPGASQAYIDDSPSPDLAAWEVFTQAVAPTGTAGDRRLEFETWASDDDIYLPFAAAMARYRRARGRRPNAGWITIAKRPAAAGLPDGACILEDVRRNWAAYRYIVANDLYSRQGLARAFQQHLKVDLPSRFRAGQSRLDANR